MATGIQAFNNSGTVLIDSDLKNYHFIGKLNPTTSWKMPSILGGTAGKKTSPDYMDASQTSGTVYIFRVYCNGVKPPLCFIKPNDRSQDVYTSQIKCMRDGEYWEVWILQTDGASGAPQLYCFTTPDQQLNLSNDTHGVQVFNANGEVSFDSRARPLRITATGSVGVPVLPHTGSLGSVYNVNLEVNIPPSTVQTGVNLLDNDGIYYCPCLANAEQEYSYYGNFDWFEGIDLGVFGSYGVDHIVRRQDVWWCFYRGGYRLTATEIQGNWITFLGGHVWDQADSNDWGALGTVIAAITIIYTGGFGGSALFGVFGAALSLAAFVSSSTAGTYRPYANSSRNANEQNTYIITKASFYD
tara:strand:+ start:7107 stop:8174 length:1068 start_codon:yes stop_codon:yes gene_type:complete